MPATKAILSCAALLALFGCAAPETPSRSFPCLEGYAVKQEVAPASFEKGFTPDTPAPGETRTEVREVPGPPADVEPPRNLDDEPVPVETFPYGAWGMGFGSRGRGHVPGDGGAR
jgi:hypothetical protein